MRKFLLPAIASLALAIAACGPGAEQPQQPMDPQPPAQPGGAPADPGMSPGLPGESPGESPNGTGGEQTTAP